MRPSLHLAAVTLFLSAFGACRAAAPPAGSDLKSFLENADATLLRLSNEANQAGFTQATFITPDTEAMSARASEAYATAVTDFARRAATFNAESATPEQQRRLTVLKNSITMAAPSDPKESAELATLVASMDGAYGRGKYCPAGESPDKCLDIEAITRILASDRNPARLREVWEGWHTISPPFKPDYVRFVALSNKGAKELGFADTGAMWRSRYDMPPDDFSKEVDRLWQQLRPLYLSLHTYVRARLHAKYGDAVPADGPIPAHLLGNIWAQDWSNVYESRRAGRGRGTVSLDAILRARATTPVQMVQHGGALLHVARVRSAAEDVLGAIAVREAPRPRGRVPRERVVRGQPWRTCASRCASIRRRRTSPPSITSSDTISTRANTTARSR